MTCGATRPAGGRRWLVVLLPVFAACLLAACALLLAELVGARVGARGLLVGAIAAVVPVVPMVAAFLWVDRWEPEPPRLILAAFAWGACIAALTALVVNDTAASAAGSLLGAGGGDAVATLVSAPLVEEAVKAAFVLGVWRLLRSEFDGVIDGIVYAGITATGFAFTENIDYFGLAFAHGGLDGFGGGVVAAFVLRGVFTPFLHPMFSMMTGIGIGIAARTRTRWMRVGAPLGGYLAAVSLHALWNASTMLSQGRGLLSFYFLVIVPILAAMVLFVGWQRKREQAVIASQLPAMVRNGWIAPSEVELLSSLRGRREWRRQVRTYSGGPAASAVRRYQAAVTELAFLAERVSRDSAEPPTDVRREELITDLRVARAEAVHATPRAG
ncbi:MAG: PrsW family intramembrane metalloprotease [Sciscionella sp.]